MLFFLVGLGFLLLKRKSIKYMRKERLDSLVKYLQASRMQVREGTFQILFTWVLTIKENSAT